MGNTLGSRCPQTHYSSYTHSRNICIGRIRRFRERLCQRRIIPNPRESDKLEDVTQSETGEDISLFPQGEWYNPVPPETLEETDEEEDKQAEDDLVILSRMLTSPIHALSNETLREIFSYCERKGNKKYAHIGDQRSIISCTPYMPVSLDQVCRRWCEVVRGCPAFWRELATAIRPHRVTVDAVEQFRQFSARAWEAPISAPWVLALIPRDRHTSEGDTHNLNLSELEFLPFIQILEPLGCNLRSLTLINAQVSDLADLRDGAFPKLQFLAVTYHETRFSREWRPQSHRPVLAFSSSPIQALHLVRPLVDMSLDGLLQFQWELLASFGEIWAPNDPENLVASRFMREALPKCHNLRFLSVHLSHVDATGQGSRSFQNEEVLSLPRLECLVIGFNHEGQLQPSEANAPDFDFWRTYSFPHLKSLCINSFKEGTEFADIHVLLPTEVAENLEIFTLSSTTHVQDFALGVQAARKMFGSIPNVKKLILLPRAWQHWLHAEYKDMSMEDGLMWLFCTHGEMDKIVLPELRHLVLTYHSPALLMVPSKILGVLSRLLGLFHYQRPHRSKLETITLIYWPCSNEEEKETLVKLRKLCARHNVQLLLSNAQWEETFFCSTRDKWTLGLL